MRLLWLMKTHQNLNERPYLISWRKESAGSNVYLGKKYFFCIKQSDKIYWKTQNRQFFDVVHIIWHSPPGVLCTKLKSNFGFWHVVLTENFSDLL